MIRESINVVNVGPLKDVEINDIRPLTVLIGNSASGKSTLMKVLSLMRFIYKRVNIRSYLRNSKISQTPFRIRMDSLLQDGMGNMVTKQSAINYSVEVNGAATYTISYRDGKLNAKVNIPDEDLLFYKESYITESRSLVPYWISNPAKNSSSNLGFYFHETLNDFDEATNTAKSQTINTFNLEMKVEKKAGQPKKIEVEQLSEEGRNTVVELRYASSGMQTTIPLLSIVHYFANDFSFKEAFQRSILQYLYDSNRLSAFSPKIELSDLPRFVHLHIEEPELSLDPYSQRRLVDEIVDMAFMNGNDNWSMGVVFATRSPFVLNELNVLLRAAYHKDKAKVWVSPEDIGVYHLVGGKAVSLMAEDGETGQKIIDTSYLSEVMEMIYNDYLNLESNGANEQAD